MIADSGRGHLPDHKVALVTAGGSGMGADASRRLAAYMTGQNLRLDGGLTRSL
ncbi:hypothetical protein [Salinarimonas sp.]|uniref:hypothetical protein n=1 Tax=Salinarimonas sp. TaxID=2766526 RepID=UPI0032D97DBA